MDLDRLRSRLNANGQEHLLNNWENKSPADRQSLYNEIMGLDLEEVCGYFRRTMSAQAQDQAKLDDRLHPVPDEVFGSAEHTPADQLRHYQKLGLEAVSSGQVGVLLLAGGQGTRLGTTSPKGMYDVGLPSGKSLYHLQAERLWKLQELAASLADEGHPRGSVTWYIMTSEATKEPTIQYFQQNDYFGLDENDLVFFEQGTLPCFTFDGQIILQSPGKLAHAPDGNGGLYRALKRQNVVQDMRKRGIQYLHVYCVDNILVKMADPIFMGYCMSLGTDCGAKVVQKAFAEEPVGVVCQVDGKYQVVEYSEITLNTAQKTNPDGKLTFSAGNTCNHFFTIDFLESVVNEREAGLLHHMAKKKIPYCDNSGKTVKPDKPNGIKMEKFVFDVFQVAKNFAVWEVLREDEFSPLKNADGAAKDTPTTARLALCSLHQRYVLAAGGQFVDADGQPIPLVASPAALKGEEANNNEAQQAQQRRKEAIICEISPLVSYAGEGLQPLVAGKKFLAPLLLNQPHASVTNGITNGVTNGHTNGTH